MESTIAQQRAELSGKATHILNARTLAASHKRLAEILEEGMTVLDIGCGTGTITRGIAEAVGASGRVVGIDSNPALINEARELHQDVPGLTCEVGDIFNLPYQDEFHIVTSARVLQWLADPLQALASMKSATKIGGKIVILDYNHEKISWEPNPPSSMQYFYAKFLQWRADAGMDNEIGDYLQPLSEQIGLEQTLLTPQYEIMKREDPDFHEKIGIWADVAASRGIQMVTDHYVTEQERLLAENDYRQWIQQFVTSQTLYLLAVEGTKIER